MFAFNAEYGYIVKDGEIGELVRDVSISGSTLQTLKNIECVGSELELFSGFCGKDGQSVPVSDGAPHLLVKLLVGGT